MRIALPLVLVLFAFAGCGEHADHDHGAATDEHHGHVHEAPHGGTLVVLAEEAAHLEFVLDPAARRLTCYVLGAHADTPIRIAQETIEVQLRSAGEPLPLTLAAVPNPLTGETVGDTSQFEVTADALGRAGAFEGLVPRVTVRGQTFTDVAFSLPGE